jgi:hypothetical protein
MDSATELPGTAVEIVSLTKRYAAGMPAAVDQIDLRIRSVLTAMNATSMLENYSTALGPLIMFAVFNRFNPAYEEAARDLGATPWQAFRFVVLPLIGPSIVGIGMFGFTLSRDEIACTSQAIGDVNTLPLELKGLTSTVTTPSVCALGTVTTFVSFGVMALALGSAALLRRRALHFRRGELRRREPRGARHLGRRSDAGPKAGRRADRLFWRSRFVRAARRRGRAGQCPGRVRGRRWRRASGWSGRTCHGNSRHCADGMVIG